MRSSFVRVAALGFVLALGSALPAFAGETTSSPAEGKQKLIENLQAAYNGESNAAARYTAFAKKADEEGYAGVAVLFRAAAQAETIHAGNHAAVLKKLGVEPKADVKPVEVKSTKENLETAIKGETYERDTMYPEFLKQAKAIGNKDAVRTFNFARSVETEHAQLYQEAAANLDSWKTKVEFYVCPVCGSTVKNLPDSKCPICFTSKEKFLKIS